MKYLFLILAGCSGIQLPPVNQGPFTPYVQTFVDEGKARNKEVSDAFSVPITFGNASDLDVEGMCTTGFGNRNIVINPNYWNGSDNDKEILIMHELGHCVLNRTHLLTENFSYFTGGWQPASIMYPKIMDGSTYFYNRKQYLDELFNVSN